MKSIIIIIPFFGTLPNTFKFWYQSALNNPTINFLLFTDCCISNAKNIKVIECSFNKFIQDIQSKFDFKINISAPYKLCDFRPAYGDIFQEYIRNYDFWGFGDVDLVYGDIRYFITEDKLNTYDIISGWGHLTLYRNNQYCNNFYKKNISGFQFYKDVFSNPQNSLFDEYHRKGIGDLWKFLHPDKVWDHRLFDDIKIPRHKIHFYSVFHPEYSNFLIFEYDNDLYRLYVKKNKIVREKSLYVHLQKRKMKIRTNNVNKYLIVPNCFINYKNVNIFRIILWGHNRNLDLYFYKVKNKIKHILGNK